MSNENIKEEWSQLFDLHIKPNKESTCPIDENERKEKRKMRKNIIVLALAFIIAIASVGCKVTTEAGAPDTETIVGEDAIETIVVVPYIPPEMVPTAPVPTQCGAALPVEPDALEDVSECEPIEQGAASIFDDAVHEEETATPPEATSTAQVSPEATTTPVNAIQTSNPTEKPTPKPTKKPTAKPTKAPTPKPTAMPTNVPTATPAPTDTPKPTETPAPTPNYQCPYCHQWFAVKTWDEVTRHENSCSSRPTPAPTPTPTPKGHYEQRWIVDVPAVIHSEWVCNGCGAHCMSSSENNQHQKNHAMNFEPAGWHVIVVTDEEEQGHWEVVWVEDP